MTSYHLSFSSCLLPFCLPSLLFDDFLPPFLFFLPSLLFDDFLPPFIFFLPPAFLLAFPPFLPPFLFFLPPFLPFFFWLLFFPFLFFLPGSASRISLYNSKELSLLILSISPLCSSAISERTMATRPRRIRAKTFVMFARWTAKLNNVVDVIEIR